MILDCVFVGCDEFNIDGKTVQSMKFLCSEISTDTFPISIKEERRGEFELYKRYKLEVDIVYQNRKFRLVLN